MKPSNAIKTALFAWGFISLLILLSLTGMYFLRGADPFGVAIQTGPFSKLPVTMSAVALTWFVLGSLLYLLDTKRINSSNAFTFAGFYLIAFIYPNFLRERIEYGDIQYYIQAATNLFTNQPLPEGYLYPPLLATLLEPLVPYGETTIFVFVWVVNLLGLFLFYFLLNTTLQRYDFSPRLAALITTLFLLINTPLIRTLGYMQVNLHTLNFILLGLLLFRKRPFLSAFCLALAVHLKASPAVLVLAFLLEKDFRWLLYFGISLLLIAVPTVIFHGFDPYISFLDNAALLANAVRVSYRDSSFDGFFTAIGLLMNFDSTFVRILVYGSKLTLACATIIVMVRTWKRRVFDSKTDSHVLFNSLPPLFILMTLSAPVVWEHHGMFLSLSFLLLLKKLVSPTDWLWFGIAYFLEFLLPTFDFFPFSYGRLVAPLILLWLTWRVSQQKDSSKFFENTTQTLENIQFISKG